MNQSGLFAHVTGIATLAQTLPGEEGRLYNLDPALAGSISTVWITTTADTAYVRIWDGPSGANPYIRSPYRDTNTDAAALQRLGYKLAGDAA